MAALSSKSVGNTVKLNVNGTATNFIVVHQGTPSASYDSSCNGTWLLMENIYSNRVWDSSDNDYASSDIHSYLNVTFIDLFDSDIRNLIKSVRLPYTRRTGQYGSLVTGSKGVSAKVFLPSYTEVGFSDGTANAEGSVLKYFSGASNSKRIAKLNSSASTWRLRSPSTANEINVWHVTSSGTAGNWKATDSGYGIRPALILPSTTNVDSSGNITTNTAPSESGTPSVPSEIIGGESTSISWTASTDADGNLSGYQLEVSLDGGSWTQIYKGSSRSYSYVVPEGTETIAFRVRAYDSASEYSSYATTSTFTVINRKIKGTVNINGVQRELTGAGYINIGGVLRDISDSGVNIGGTIKSLKG